MFINNKSYTVHQLETEEVFEQQTVSAPATPSLRSYNDQETEDEFDFHAQGKELQETALEEIVKNKPHTIEDKADTETSASHTTNTPEHPKISS